MRTRCGLAIAAALNVGCGKKEEASGGGGTESRPESVQAKPRTVVPQAWERENVRLMVTAATIQGERLLVRIAIENRVPKKVFNYKSW